MLYRVTLEILGGKKCRSQIAAWNAIHIWIHSGPIHHLCLSAICNLPLFFRLELKVRKLNLTFYIVYLQVWILLIEQGHLWCQVDMYIYIRSNDDSTKNTELSNSSSMSIWWIQLAVWFCKSAAAVACLDKKQLLVLQLPPLKPLHHAARRFAGAVTQICCQ